MKIVMFSINPLFPERVIGGSTKHLKNVATFLGQLGHDVQVLCTKRPDTRPFAWHPRVQVKPSLAFKQPFPQPYDMPAFHLAANIQDMAEALADADRFYMHDGEFLFPPVYQHVPTIVSLRDNVYPETILGSFLFQADVLIAIAEYSRQVYLNTAGRFIPALHQRAITVHNGIDWDEFRPKEVDPAIFQYIPIEPEQHSIVLHPHRPEPTKGLDQTIRVADRLVHDYGMHDLRVLVPRWFDTDASPEVQAYLHELENEIADRGLQEVFLFHDWIPHHLMPDYYNLGNVMLALGSFVEAFGNTVYESLGCGTPAIAARIATHRSLVPDDLLPKVHHGDADGAARMAAEAITSGQKSSPELMAYLHEHYGMQQQLEGYASAILQAGKLPPVTYRFPSISEATRFRLAPWTYQWGKDRFYHDYRAVHATFPALSELLTKFPEGFTDRDARELDLEEEVERWYRDGYLVPVMPESTITPQGLQEV